MMKRTVRFGKAQRVAAVVNAGAPRFVTALTEPKSVERAKEHARIKEMTDKLFGVNLTILPTITPPLYAEYRHAIIGGGIWSAGTVQALVHDIPTVKDLISRIVSEAEAIIRSRLKIGASEAVTLSGGGQV